MDILRVFLGLRAHAVLVPKSHVALRASRAAFPLLTSTFPPYGVDTPLNHFPTLYLLSKLSLREGQLNTVWEPSKHDIPLPHLNVVSHDSPSFSPYSLFLPQATK
jgi:hypothetical protein